MAQHHRMIITPSYGDDNEYTCVVHQCSVSDIVSVNGEVDIDHGYKVAAAIIEAYRFRGNTIDEQFDMIRKQIKEWDDTGDHS